VALVLQTLDRYCSCKSVVLACTHWITAFHPSGANGGIGQFFQEDDNDMRDLHFECCPRWLTNVTRHSWGSDFVTNAQWGTHNLLSRFGSEAIEQNRNETISRVAESPRHVLSVGSRRWRRQETRRDSNQHERSAPTQGSSITGHALFQRHVKLCDHEINIAVTSV
jgi:hypothetical protein